MILSQEKRITPETESLAQAWFRLSRMKGIPLASLARRPEHLDALFRGALLAASNAVDNRAGLVNFKRRLASFLLKYGGWLAADAAEITDMMTMCGVISVTDGRVQVQMRLPHYRADAFEVFKARLSDLLEEDAARREAKRRELQQKNLSVNARPAPAANAAEDAIIMREAVIEARLAAERGEVPVGCVIAMEGNIVSRAGNRVRELKDPTAHAEILAIRKAASGLGTERLAGATLYVTLEPCAMCAAAAAHARIGRIVWGADDLERGAISSTVNVIRETHMTTQPAFERGVQACECSAMLKSFFCECRQRRVSGAK